MKPRRATKRQFAAYLILSSVLVLGIAQWSFLPLLVQNAPLSGKASLEVSNGHTSKFAAPFKCFLADSLNPCAAKSMVFVHRVTASFIRPLDQPATRRDDHVFSLRQFRAPPSA